MITSLGIEANDQKKRAKLEPAVFISYLNTRLESTHEKLFDLIYQHEVLYKVLVKSHNDYKSTEEVYNAFEGVTESGKLQQSIDYKSQLNKEMVKFNGKGEGGDNMS